MDTGSTAAGDGTALHWTDTGGDGPPDVLVHGVRVGGLSWLCTAQALESDHRVVMPDLRGHGQRDATVTTRTHVDDVTGADVTAVLDAAGIEHRVVVGHSMGADIAGVLASRHPVRGVVLVDPALRPMPPEAFDVDDPPPWMAVIFDTLRSLTAQPHAERMLSGLGMLPPGVRSTDTRRRCRLRRGPVGVRSASVPPPRAEAPLLAASPGVISALACPILLLTARPIRPDADLDAEVAAFTTALARRRPRALRRRRPCDPRPTGSTASSTW